ncbi:phage head morphogenesis protein [Oceanobacillus oncorhynchi subsp. incaldanensis]|uniref:minor capsid protein n=1 Tax=Oceanobacillus oncorhynchi TaxID=545501 RepID=UPI001B2050CE|nr:minor capsid protein [Oceanobacillus oncorhynchi]GIO18145.1 phage head morphogenesis protein [Oceanobacillus oncorhynchi subsp. incaldanensis]
MAETFIRPSNSRDYWIQRERHQSLTEHKNDDEITAIMQAHLRTASDEIDKEINRIYGKYAGREGMTMSEARKLMDSEDVRMYEEKAARYVRDQDFSSKANAEMKKYNARMRTSRLKLIQMHIDLELSKANGLNEREVQNRLQQIARSEIQRQSGILGITVRLSESEIRNLTKQKFHGEYFSDRIWQNKNHLVRNLNKQLRSHVTQGKGPLELAQRMRADIGNSVFNTERILRTETARVQMQAQTESYTQTGITEFEFISEADACEECLYLNGSVFPVTKMEPGYNAAPIHPNCRCGTMPVIPED